MNERPIQVGALTLGGGAFTLIAGPGRLENPAQILETVRMVRAAGATLLRGGPAEGPRDEALAHLQDAGLRFGMPLVTEVLSLDDLPSARGDLLQAGLRDLPLLEALGRQDKPVLLTRDPEATLQDLLQAAERLGNPRVILCERGIRTFDPATPATLPVEAIPLLKGLTALPVIVDPGPVAVGRAHVAPLALAAAAAGADGLLLEAHARPDSSGRALSGDELLALAAALGPILASQSRILQG